MSKEILLRQCEIKFSTFLKKQKLEKSGKISLKDEKELSNFSNFSAGI